MTDRTNRSVCWLLLAFTLVGIGARVVQASAGPPDVATSVWLDRLAFWVGTIVPQMAYAFIQSRPGGRGVVPLWGEGRRNDGWLFVLVASQLVSILPVALNDGSDAISNLPHVAMTLVASMFIAARAWQLRASSDARGA